MKHLPLRELGYALAVIAVLLGLYVGAYFAMVERIDFGEMISSVRPYRGPAKPVVFYRYGGDWSRSFFFPAHRLDRQLRPELWAGELEPRFDEWALFLDFGKK